MKKETREVLLEKGWIPFEPALNEVIRVKTWVIKKVGDEYFKKPVEFERSKDTYKVK